MSDQIDYYEILEVSSSASFETIDRVFRYLAQKFHPDNQDTGDVERFTLVVKAHDILRNPETRAAYDIHYQKLTEHKWRIFDEASDADCFENDEIIQERVLSILYTKRKHNMRNPGLSYFELERLTGCPSELLEFHMWFIKDKNWIERLDTGLLAITAEGVERLINQLHEKRKNKLLTDQRNMTS